MDFLNDLNLETYIQRFSTNFSYLILSRFVLQEDNFVFYQVMNELMSNDNVFGSRMKNYSL